MPRIIDKYAYPIEFSVSSPHLPLFLQQLEKVNIHISNVRYKGDKCIARCKIRDYRAITKIAHKSCTKICISKKPPLIFGAFSFFSNHFALLISCVVALFLLGIASKTVWQIQVIGQVDGITSDSIVEQLKPLGIYVGSNPTNTTKSCAEMSLMSYYDNLAWVHINRKGALMEVEIKQATPKPKVTPKYNSNFVATADGLIILAKVYNGWQEKRVGDSVTKGDILINGVYENKDKKLNLFAHADGEYIAQVEETVKVQINRQQVHNTLIGTKDYRYLYFFGITIPLTIGRIPKQNVKVEISKRFISVNENEIPIGVFTKSVSSYQKETVNLSDLELLDMLKEQTNKKLISEYGKENIIATNIDYSLNSQNGIAVGTITATKSIGEVRRITK